MSENLFEEFAGMTRRTVKVALKHESTTKPIVFEIHTVTANEMLESDDVISAKPPAIYQDQASPSRVGTVKALVGYDHDDPKYIAERQKQLPVREAMICIYGCPALRETTPGTTAHEKADTLVQRIPAMVVSWLCQKIETISIEQAVGEEDVSLFLANGSGDSPNSRNSKKRRSSGAA